MFGVLRALYTFYRETFKMNIPADGCRTTKTVGRLEETSIMKLVTVQSRPVELLDTLTVLWERSVRTTHRFLSTAEIDAIKKDMPKALQTVERLIFVVNKSDSPLGFMGIGTESLKCFFWLPKKEAKAWVRS